MAKKSKYASASTMETTRRMNFPRPVHGLFRLDSMREEKTRGGEGITVELTAVKVISTPAATDYETGGAYQPHTAGETVQDRMLGTNVGFDRWIKSVALAASGMSDGEFQESESYPGENIEDALSDDQPLAGTVIEMRAVVVVKEKSREKAEEDLTGSDVYVRTDYLRAIPFADLAAQMDEGDLQRFFPNLDELVAEEAA